MANADAAFGFRPINRDGSPYNGATIRCVIAAADTTATFIGDAVVLDGTSDTGYPGVSQAAAGEAVFGVVTAFEADPDGLGNQYRIASTKRFCQVVGADQSYFEIQSDDDTTALAEAGVGLNANFVVGTGNTTYGVSAMELDSDGAATTSTLDLQIVGLVDRADNQLADTGSTNKNVIVRFNDPQSKPFRTGV
jgi:hypothetical protein